MAHMSNLPVREQRNPYKGRSPRALIWLHLVGADNSSREYVCMVDTGSPFALIVHPVILASFVLRDRHPVETNFGRLEGGWIRCLIPEVGFDALVAAYAGERVIDSAKSSSADFNGVVGLPFLRNFEYGGDSG